MDKRQTFPVAAFILDAQNSARLDADAAGCTFETFAVDPLLGIHGNRELLLAALANLLQNAFKFSTHTRRSP